MASLWGDHLTLCPPPFSVWGAHGPIPHPPSWIHHWLSACPKQNFMLYNSQGKEKSYQSSFYFWAICGSDVTLSAVPTNKKHCLPLFRRIRGFVYLRRQTIKPSSNSDWSIAVLFSARGIDLSILHSTVVILPYS